MLHIDGKAARAVSEKSKGEKPIYHLNAMYEGESIGVVVKRVGEKENEISCLPDYLEQFELSGTIVTMDAIGCNQTVINAIQESGGNYVLLVKENRKRLLAAINEEIECLIEEKKWDALDCTETLRKDHGRIEKTTCRMVADTSFCMKDLDWNHFMEPSRGSGLWIRQQR